MLDRLRRAVFGSAPASIGCCLALWAISIPAAAQSTAAAPSGPAVTYSSQSELVMLPVIVTRSDGEHILHLDKSRFRLFENGSEQKISVFEEISPHPVPSLSKTKSTSAGEFTNVVAQTRSRT